MSSIIKILPDHVVNKIAAGEVVERPASVVKELIENSIDAGATEIFIDIEQAGKRLIRIIDNGGGMSKEDAEACFLRHATSKIRSDADLEAIRTMGFRGEALSSIASVSRIRMLTARQGDLSGLMIELEGGTIKNVSETAATKGTSIEISHLFYNTPARLKFLKSPATEFSHILTAVSRQAMAHPHIRFRITHDKKPVLELPSSQGFTERVFQLYGGELAENLIQFSGKRDVVGVYGLIGRPAYTRADRSCQDFYVNNRAVKNPSLTHALYGAYGDMLMRGRHPVGFIFIDMDPALVDVNVHPAKAEVRFRNQSQIHDLVWEVLREGLRNERLLAAGVPDAETGAGDVREAAEDYVAGQSFAGGAGPVNYAPLLRRRKTDLLPADHQQELLPPPFQEVVPERRMQKPLLSEQYLYPVSQIHDSFIIAQSREGMAIVDQHAAHERVLFEKLQDQHGAGEVPVQNLLIPAQVDLGPAEASLLSEQLGELDRFGLRVEDFGGGTFVIKSVPSLLVGADYKRLLLDILDEVKVHGRSGKIDELRKDVLSVMACHPAIKINRRLDIKEMEILLADLFSCRMPHTCPHGRPTVVRFSMEEIKKMFKRI